MSNLSKFVSKFRITENRGNSPVESRVGTLEVDQDLKDAITSLGGKSFNDGLYRVYRGDEITAVTKTVVDAFPEYADQIIVFAADWLGRQFAVDYGRTEGGKPLVLLIEVGAGEAAQIPCSIIQFHNEELTEYQDDALALPFFKQWAKGDPKSEVGYSDCIGYKVPLFLGGEDTVENLERINMALYIDVCGQLRSKTMDLKDGQKISQVKITSPH